MLAVLAGVICLGSVAPSPARAAFGFESLSSTFSAAGEEGGALLAGSHPEFWTTKVAFNSSGPLGERYIEGALKDVHVELPVGLVATSALLPHCSHVDFLAEACSSSTAVGSINLASSELPDPIPVFLLDAIRGQAAQLGFHAAEVPLTIDVSLAPTPPYRLIASITKITQVKVLFEFRGAILTLDGAPDGNAFLTMPRSCDARLRTGFAATSWQDHTAAVLGVAPESQSVIGCASLPYAPSLKVRPTTADTSSPSGIDVTVDASEAGLTSASGRAAADTRSATMSLPPELTINPPAAAGLTACTATQLAAEAPDPAPGQGCPQTSKVGTAIVTTPLFSEPIDGAIYLGVPAGSNSAISTSNSATHLVLDLVLRNGERGISLSLPIQVAADTASGRLTASLEQLPELPISHVELHFNSGPRAPLTTPAACGPAAIAYSLTPSSGNPPLRGSDSFTISGPDCTPRFVPSFSAGTTSTAAGRSSAFVFELGQSAGAPNLAGAHLTLPPGLAASFAAATICPEGQAASGACPPGSKLGYARIALGSGPEPLWVPAGERPDSAVYLAGPYKGAPYSLVIVVPGQAGPFDLGTVVLRAPIAIDPRTAQASIDVEGLPQILDGVPLRYRTIRVVLDRPGFIRNPTSCEPVAITGTARAIDGSSAAISSRFQAADCAALSFKPKLSLRLSGAVRRNGHPAVRAVVRGDPEGAAISSVGIGLPAGELVDLRHLGALCPLGVAVDRCPRRSALGNLRLDTPLLDEPLEGRVYLRAPRHRLPGLAAEVRSGAVRFLLDGRITLAKGRLGVALASLPDIPLSRAVLTLAGGRRGILVNSRSLCRRIGAITARLAAHNGRQRRLRIRPRHRGHC